MKCITISFLILLLCVSPAMAIIKPCTSVNCMNQTPNMTAGPPGLDNMTANMTAGPPGDAGDVSWNLSYYLRDNSRTLTSEKVRRDVDNDLLTFYGGNAIAGGTGGILSLFGKDTVNPFAIEMGVGNGGVGNVRVTGWVGGANPRMDMNGYNITGIGTITSPSDAVNLSYLQDSMSGIIDSDSTVTFNVSADEVLKKGQSVYISGATGINIRVARADPTDPAKCRVVGLVTTDLELNAKGSVRRSGMLFNVDTRATNLNINPYGQSWIAGDLLFAEKGGGMSKVRNASGRTVKTAYVTRDGNINGNLLAYPFENPVWSTAASGENVVLRLGDTIGATNVSIRNYTNVNVASIDSLGNASFRYINNVISGSSGSDVVNKSYVDSVNTSMRNNVSANFVPMVNQLAPTVNLGGAGADNTKYLRGDQTWQAVTASAPTSATAVVISSDFYSPGVPAIPGLLGTAVSSGTSTIPSITTASHPGVIRLLDSASAAGGYRFGCDGEMLIAGGESFEVIFQSVGTRSTQSTKLGWSDDAAAASLPVDGVWFNLSRVGAAMSISGNTSSNSVRWGTVTKFAPTAATWYRGTININSVGTLVTYTIYDEAGVQQWTDTIATNIPTGAGRYTSPCITVAESTTDVAAEILRLDYASWSITRALVR